MNNRITLSKAMKLYNGRSMPELILKMSLLSMGVYALMLAFIFLIGLAGGDDSVTVRSEMAGSLMADSFFMISAGLINIIMAQMTYEKHMPGGKFFRTVKGGFDTYKKASTAICISRVAIAAIITAFASLLHISGIVPMKYGIVTTVTVFVLVLVAMCICNFLSMRLSSTVSFFFALIIYFVIGIAAVIILEVTGGTPGIVQLVPAVTTAVLLPVSHNMLMKVYKEKRWN